VLKLPTYEFECTRCPSRFELKRGFHEEGPVSCPGCGGKAKRRFSSVPIIFKGSGFYVTDSRGGDSFVSGSNPDEPKPTTAEAGAPAPSQAAKTDVASPGNGKSEVKVAANKDKSEPRASAGKDKVSAGKEKS
jgi:putative FmdB family regulatory protein